MKSQLSPQTALLAIAALSGSLFLAACGGGGGGGSASTPPALAPIAGVTPGIIEGTVSGVANGTTTGTINGTSVGVSSGTINGTSVGVVNGTVTGTVTQVVGTGTASNNVVNTPVSSTGSVTVTGTVTGIVTGTVTGTVNGTVTGNITGTVTGVVQGTASGTVTAPAVSAASAQAIAAAYLQGVDSFFATFKPTGAERFGQLDGCYLENGRSKAFLINDWDNRTDNQVRTAFEIASTRANTSITVLADRTLTNSDGSARRELDLQYSINYTDGTRNNIANTTIISGSSAGSRNADATPCNTSENKAAWRNYGNRRIVDFSMAAVNEDYSRQNLSNGSDKTPNTYYNNYIDLRMRDPANVATYYTISGPGLTSGGNPAIFIGVSPRLLRSDPLFAGKVGNAVDWRDIDSFRLCRVSASNGAYAPAATANCPVAGASGSTVGAFNNTTEAAADTAFNAFGFVAGGVYNIAVYSGTGWSTVNGFAAATPITTFTHTLNALPYSAVALRPASGTLFPDLNGTVTSVVSTDTGVSLAQIIRDKSAFTANLTWQTPPVLPDGTRAGILDSVYFVQGPIPGSTASWPRSRQLNIFNPAPGSTSFTLTQPALNSNIGTPNFGQINLTFTNRNGNGVVSGGTFD